MASNGNQSFIHEIFSKEEQLIGSDQVISGDQEQPNTALVMTHQDQPPEVMTTIKKQPIIDCSVMSNDEQPEIAVLEVSTILNDLEQADGFIADSEAPRNCLEIPQSGIFAFN